MCITKLLLKKRSEETQSLDGYATYVSLRIPKGLLNCSEFLFFSALGCFMTEMIMTVSGVQINPF